MRRISNELDARAHMSVARALPPPKRRLPRASQGIARPSEAYAARSNERWVSRKPARATRAAMVPW